MSITFSKNLHDKDGDVYNHGIFLFFDDSFVLRLDTEKDLDLMIENLQKIKEEIKNS